MSDSSAQFYHPFYLEIQREAQSTNKRLFGKNYEVRAAEYLCAKGYKILTTNYQCRCGEIDLIAESPENVIVFVEVKARSSDAFGSAGGAVTKSKQQKIVRTARQYIFEHKLAWHRDYRFDVVLFENHTLEHIENAFNEF